WTRLPEATRDAFVEVTRDPSFRFDVTRSRVRAAPDEDGTVRVQVPVRAADATYYYRFQQGRRTSPVGRVPPPSTTGRPRRDQPDVFLWGAGTDGFLRPFSVLDALRVGAIDAFLYAGDTIAADDSRGDGVVAATFADFARKYRANRADSALRNLLQSTVTLAVPDDGEVRPHFAGAEPGFAALGAAGVHAFRSYLPIGVAADDPSRLYRRIRWGTLVELFLLDARQYRTAEIVCCADGSVESLTVPGQTACAGVGPMLEPDDACLAALAA